MCKGCHGTEQRGTWGTRLLWEVSIHKTRATRPNCAPAANPTAAPLRSMADHWLRVLISMLRYETLYDVQRRAA